MNLQAQADALFKMDAELKAAPKNAKGKINGTRFNAIVHRCVMAIVHRCVMAIYNDGEKIEDARAMAKEVWKKYE